LVLKKTDINLVLKKAVELVKINYKEVIFKEILTPYLYSPLDIDKFQQILVNLLDNAAKYGRGYVEIKTGLRDTKVFIQLKNSSEPLKNFELDKIFEKFYRCQTYLTSKKEGSGLGLYIVKMLTEKMNGKIFVKSDKETIEFTLEFPLFAPEEFTKGAHIV
ncbi:MAG: HAMP domain-containing histidine kinase, partial [Candidatus Gastranaerophilales bacterium]|nr:HAMP domain-containing histidine kinase [Candidatus Gastranaerophilales bacterium]